MPQELLDFTWGFANRGGHHDWPFVMALKRGFFEEEGINLRIETVAGGDALAQAMGRGQLQVGRMGAPPFLAAVDKDVVRAKIVASSVIGNLDHFFFVVRREIENISLLRGKTVGVLSCGSCDGHLMRLELKRAGLDPDRDVAFREVWENYDSLDGLASGEVAAQLLVEPLVSLGELRGILRVVEPVSKALPRFQWGLLIARADFVTEHSDMLRRLLRAYLRGVRDCVANPEEMTAAIAQWSPEYDSRVINRALTRTLPIWNTTGQVDLTGLGIAVETMLSLGRIRRKLNPAALVDTSALNG